MSFPSTSLAIVARDALAPDPELQPHRCRRELSVEGESLVVSFSAVDAKVLRVSVNTLMDHLKLSTETMVAFKQEEP